MTGYGVSEPMYRGRSCRTQGLLPIMGVLQGNGMGPLVWVIISSVLIGCMHQMGFASFLIGCLTGATLQMMGYAFVDYTDLCFTGQDNHQLAAHLLPQFSTSGGLLGRSFASHWRRTGTQQNLLVFDRPQVGQRSMPMVLPFHYGHTRGHLHTQGWGGNKGELEKSGTLGSQQDTGSLDGNG